MLQWTLQQMPSSKGAYDCCKISSFRRSYRTGLMHRIIDYAIEPPTDLQAFLLAKAPSCSLRKPSTYMQRLLNPHTIKEVFARTI